MRGRTGGVVVIAVMAVVVMLATGSDERPAAVGQCTVDLLKTHPDNGVRNDPASRVQAYEFLQACMKSRGYEYEGVASKNFDCTTGIIHPRNEHCYLAKRSYEYLKDVMGGTLMWR